MTPAIPADPHPDALPAEPTQARRFGKARSAQASAVLEDYVELIADLLASSGEARPIDIARRLGVSHPTAVKSIARLKREGLATARPYRGVFLTEAGHALAERVRARHRLVVALLLAVGCRQRRRKRMPRASSTTSPRRRCVLSAGFCGTASKKQFRVIRLTKHAMNRMAQWQLDRAWDSVGGRHARPHHA